MSLVLMKQCFWGSKPPQKIKDNWVSGILYLYSIHLQNDKPFQKSQMFRHLWGVWCITLGLPQGILGEKKIAGRHREKQWQSIHGRSRIDVAPGFWVSDWENTWKKWMVMNMLYLEHPGTLNNHCLVDFLVKQPVFNGWIFGETLISHRGLESSNWNNLFNSWMFRVPGRCTYILGFSPSFNLGRVTTRMITNIALLVL